MWTNSAHSNSTEKFHAVRLNTFGPVHLPQCLHVTNIYFKAHRTAHKCTVVQHSDVDAIRHHKAATAQSENALTTLKIQLMVRSSPPGEFIFMSWES